MKYEVEITKENCEGYSELYKNYNFNDEENKIIGKATLKSFLLLSVGLVILPIAGASANVIALASIPALALVMGTFLKTSYDVNKKKMDSLKEKYPNIDVKASYYELERALEKANILKFVNSNKTKYVLDLSAYNSPEKYDVKSEENEKNCEHLQINPMNQHQVVERGPKVKVKIK